MVNLSYISNSLCELIKIIVHIIVSVRLCAIWNCKKVQADSNQSSFLPYIQLIIIKIKK